MKLSLLILISVLLAAVITGGAQMLTQTTCARLDHPDILRFIFHPRKDVSARPAGALDYTVTVDAGVVIGCRFFIDRAAAPGILFFHGNGEVVSDYDDLGPVYTRYGMNFFAVDYRGYGASSGTPTVSAMLQDARAVFRAVQQWRQANGHTGPLIVMGRSLGSASALEIAACFEHEIAGLIIESGFAYTVPLLNFLGADTRSHGIQETDCLRHIEKIQRCSKPTLIIHAEFDQFIPLADAEALLRHSPARKKQLKMIPGADHNTILMTAGRGYFETINTFISTP
jgi:hypothetical protein